MFLASLRVAGGRGGWARVQSVDGGGGQSWETGGPRTRQEVGGLCVRPHSRPHTKARTGPSRSRAQLGPLLAPQVASQLSLAKPAAGFPLGLGCRSPSQAAAVSTGTESGGLSFCPTPAARGKQSAEPTNPVLPVAAALGLLAGHTPAVCTALASPGTLQAARVARSPSAPGP